MANDKMKLTKEQCIKFATMMMPGDNFFVSGSDFVAKMIQFGTGDVDFDGVEFNPNHVGVYSGNGQGQTVEADGKEVAYHLIEDYFAQLQNAKVRIIVYRIKNLTVPELDTMKTRWKGMIGQKYNNAVNVWFGVWGVVRLIPGIGWLAGKIRNPGYKKDSPNCSIATTQIDSSIPRIGDTLADKQEANRTPENLYDSIKKSDKWEKVVDTAKIG